MSNSEQKFEHPLKTRVKYLAKRLSGDETGSIIEFEVIRYSPNGKLILLNYSTNDSVISSNALWGGGTNSVNKWVEICKFETGIQVLDELEPEL